MEVLLKGQLKAGLTDFRVHGVALILVFRPLAVVHAAKVAQDVGGVLGVVFPDGGGLNVQTRSVQLQNGGQLLVGDVLQEGVGRQVGDTAQVKFVSEADDRPGVLIGPAGGNVVAGTHLLHQHYAGLRKTAPRDCAGDRH